MYTSILNMHLSQDLAERIREDEAARRESIRAERTRQFSDVCKAIAAILFDDEYQAWVDAMPESGLFDYAAAKLLDLMRSPIWTSYTPSIQELNQRSYKGLHAVGHNCPHCGVDLIVNERADKTTNEDRPFFTRRLVCPCWSTVGCAYKEKWTDAVMIELYLQAMKLESAEAEF